MRQLLKKGALSVGILITLSEGVLASNLAIIPGDSDTQLIVSDTNRHVTLSGSDSNGVRDDANIVVGDLEALDAVGLTVSDLDVVESKSGWTVMANQIPVRRFSDKITLGRYFNQMNALAKLTVRSPKKAETPKPKFPQKTTSITLQSTPPKGPYMMFVPGAKDGHSMRIINLRTRWSLVVPVKSVRDDPINNGKIYISQSVAKVIGIKSDEQRVRIEEVKQP